MTISSSSTLLVAAAILAAACGAAPSDATQSSSKVIPSLASITVSMSDDAITIGRTSAATARGLDQAGASFAVGSIQWTSSNPSVASVSDSGIVFGNSPGGATITALAQGKSGSAAITVTAGAAITLEVSPNKMTLYADQTMQLSASLKDSAGNQVKTTTLTWVSGDTSKAVVSAAGVVTARMIGTATISATLAGMNATATLTIVPLFAEVTAGHIASCSVLVTNEALCWGDGRDGQRGDGSPYTSLIPTKINGAPSFRSVSAGFFSACSTLLTGETDCWGRGTEGQLGNGSLSSRSSPLAIGPSPVFLQVVMGNYHACGLDATGEIYCWGSRITGDGSNEIRAQPVKVSSQVRFKQVGAGEFFSCALSVDGAAFCWGENPYGQLANGGGDALVPTPVLGGLTFASIAVGEHHVCALTLSGAAYCWGFNGAGQLGDGTTTSRSTPVLVSGTTTFAKLDGGGSHTCGLTAGGEAFCWGFNGDGELGDGTQTNRTSPVAVIGGRRFLSVSAGSDHSCGIDAGKGRAYCWGSGEFGQIGSGSSANATAPVEVLYVP